MEFEHTPKEMAEKLMRFIKDLSCYDEDIEDETKYITSAFAKLQQTDDQELNALANHLDAMFMDEVFDIK